MKQSKTDIEIIHQILNGEYRQYEILVKRHQNYVFTLAFRFTRNRENAEEIAQDTFVKAYKALATFKQESKFSTWLYTITYTTAMNYLRKKDIQKVDIASYEIISQLESSLNYQYANNFEKKDIHQKLNKAITLLNADDANIITLFYNAELSLEEISKILGIDTNTIKVRLFRARLKLKSILEKSLKTEINHLL